MKLRTLFKRQQAKHLGALQAGKFDPSSPWVRVGYYRNRPHLCVSAWMGEIGTVESVRYAEAR